MANLLLTNTTATYTGLASYTWTAPAAGPYNLQVALSEFVPSSLALIVAKNASTIYTMPALSPTQSGFELKVQMNLAQNDVITITPSSTDDKALNSVKLTLSIGQGQ